MGSQKCTDLRRELLSNSKTLVTREHHLQLLEEVKNNDVLLNSKIMSSLQPKIGYKYKFADLEIRKRELLLETRKNLLQLSMEEANRDITNINNTREIQLASLDLEDETHEVFMTSIRNTMLSTSNLAKKKINKKSAFHGSQVSANFTPPSLAQTKRSVNRKSRRRMHNKYKAKSVKRKKDVQKEAVRQKIDKLIDDFVIVNFFHAPAFLPRSGKKAS